MKRLFVSVVALAATMAFTSCGGITFTGLEKDLTIDLGDRTAALDGVSAKGKKDIPKEDITIVGLDYVGVGKLTYTAKEDSEEATDTRNVTIKPDKLFGNYGVSDVDLINGGTPLTYNVEAKKSATETKLVITNWGGQGWDATFVGNGSSMKLTMESIDLGNGTASVTGTAEYHTLNNGYEIYQVEYTIVYADGTTPTEKYKATLSKR